MGDSVAFRFRPPCSRMAISAAWGNKLQFVIGTPVLEGWTSDGPLRSGVKPNPDAAVIGIPACSTTEAPKRRTRP
jgi:hypothetical protein